MDILVELTRKLGAAIQQDERYIAFAAAKKAKDEDKALADIIGKINLLQLSYQQEAQKGDLADSHKLESFEDEYGKLCGEAMLNSNMSAFEKAATEVDKMMKYLVGILSLCVDGDDPQTCEPQDEHDHDCDGSCSSCSGCH